MTSKPFDFKQAQDDYLRERWTPEFYEAVDQAVKRKRISLLQVLMDMQAVAYKDKQVRNDPSRNSE